MVMAVNESVLKQGVDDSLSTKIQLLRQRRELLEEKLSQKNNELKNLCIAEAELTGVLPPEIPLEPGESPPNFRRRLTPSFGTCVNVPMNIKNSEADELELERQIQIRLAEDALRVINDLSENRAVRRKQRSVYQQCQRKLQELDARLNFIRQSTSSRVPNVTVGAQTFVHNSTKHRMKKPRPPLTSSLRDSYVKPLHEQGGVSLSPQETKHNYNREYYDRNCQLTPSGVTNHSYIPYSVTNTVERMNSTKFFEHEQNINNNIYILPDQFRSRTLSQGAQRNTSPRGQARYHETDRIHRTLTNSYSDDDRQVPYRYYQDEADNVPKLAPHYRYMDNEIQHRMSQIQPVDESYPTHQRYTQPLEYSNHCKNSPQIPAVRRPDQDNISVVDGRSHGLPRYYTLENSTGYWVKQNGDLVWYPEDKYIEKFGSLDRRKQNNVQNTVNSEGPPRYHTVVSVAKNASTSHRQNQQMPHNSSTNFDPPEVTNRILRTQSLGSVESRQSNRDSPLDKDNSDLSRRKEKGWYETSLDSSCSPPIAPTTLRPSNSTRVERHYEHIPAVRKDSELPYRPRPAEPHSEFVEIPREEPVQHIVNNVNRYYDAPKVLEIPAESKPSQHAENSEITIPLNSPTNHTIVQPGKYQPYREVTKPFEMSDFYKYSTKFRKRNEANQMAAALASLGNEAASATEHPSNPPVQNKSAHQLTQQSGQFYEPR